MEPGDKAIARRAQLEWTTGMPPRSKTTTAVVLPWISSMSTYRALVLLSDSFLPATHQVAVKLLFCGYVSWFNSN